ncbi:hypothetical protein CLV51_102310 [Chitinophaga niastensis]|uniref:DUF4129 domain-containing protein n=1 Tax=Chitinophaga niastensis TaxID=536980 RepID=A0A2P8HML2_CHINA|nr:hypothetical protein [Chitinophaga niastensis]PSL47462.1 hypothetical protein CLV51_102310 [Chitinophaga niastensis]
MKFFELKMYLIKGWLLLLLCLPLTGIAQEQVDTAIDTIAVDSTSSAAVQGNSTAQHGEEQDITVYEMRKIPGAMVKELQEDKRLQYRDKEEKKPVDNTWAARFILGLIQFIFTIRYVLMALLLLGLGFMLYIFMKNNGMSIFRKPQLIGGLEEIQEEELHSAEEYEGKINAAIKSGDIRQAIRWWYLYTLFQLASRQLIIAGREKTNNDYLRSMRESPYYKKFATLTLDYEYIWYGGFEVSEENFRDINQQFRDFNNTLGKAS